jgi:hypothetical protein
MPESNGQNHEQRIAALEQARKELEDNLIVISAIESKQTRAIERLTEESERRRKEDEEHRTMNRRTDERIEKLVSAIGELMSRLPPPEAKA